MWPSDSIHHNSKYKMKMKSEAINKKQKKKTLHKRKPNKKTNTYIHE